MDQYIGKMLDNRYEILERIGTGGMAVVYKAKCHRLNRMVAVKILKSDLAQDEDFRRRFNAEAQAVAQLSHPNIVSVYDVPRGGDTEYIVMELIDGITLKQYMEKRGQLNWRESLHFITQIMRGLSHAHSRGIVHRDIKPQNVMVLRDGSVKVADFGIACLENAAQTLTQEALGSVHYISPEQARGDRTDARTDVYSAGVVLYEMLTGRLPFEGDSAVSVAIQHLSSIPLAPREVNPEIPEQLELICMKAMAPDLEKRYPSADAMIADLEAFRKNPGVSLDFELEDLRPEEEDEPTRLLRSGNHTAAVAAQPHRPVREAARRDYDDYEPPHGGGAKRAALVVCGGLVAVVAVFFLFRGIFSSFLPKESDTSEVPALLGMTLEQAEAAKGDFLLINEGEIASDDYAPGQIAKQVPAAGEKRKGEERKVQVWVSSGEATGTMIDITGIYTVASAQVDPEMRSLIKEYGLELKETEPVYSDEVGEGFIISTVPAEGEPLKKGDTVWITVSKGMEQVEIIPFVNIHIDTVQSQLDPMGLAMGDVEEVDSDKPKGTVVEQDPKAGEKVDRGTKINFKISKGPAEGGDTPVDGQGTAMLTVALPPEKSSGYVEVYLDGSLVVDDRMDFEAIGWNFVQEFTGTGTADVRVDIDGREYWTTVLEFSNDG